MRGEKLKKVGINIGSDFSDKSFKGILSVLKETAESNNELAKSINTIALSNLEISETIKKVFKSPENISLNNLHVDMSKNKK